jgi:hypothetical protein
MPVAAGGGWQVALAAGDVTGATCSAAAQPPRSSTASSRHAVRARASARASQAAATCM